MIQVILRSEPGQGSNSADEPQYYLVDRAQWRFVSRPRLWRPPTDVYELNDSIVIRMEIAGMEESNFSISLHDRQLIIAGVRSDTPERRAYYQMEIPFGEFALEIDLPLAVDASQVTASYTDGFLKIVLPKAQAHFIEIEE
jgi:HSP20 family molecular chaperone IbpA